MSVAAMIAPTAARRATPAGTAMAMKSPETMNIVALLVHITDNCALTVVSMARTVFGNGAVG